MKSSIHFFASLFLLASSSAFATDYKTECYTEVNNGDSLYCEASSSDRNCARLDQIAQDICRGKKKIEVQSCKSNSSGSSIIFRCEKE